MPSWTQLLNHFDSLSDDNARTQFLTTELQSKLQEVSARRSGRSVIFYASAFLQKPQAPAERIIITPEDINGLMTVVHGLPTSDGLTLILHTPGGSADAADSIVAYLRSKFPSVEVVVPTFAMSAGTMIALSSDLVVMGRQSQLGPIDPQMAVGGGRYVSAQAIVDQFGRAQADIQTNPILAHAWAPALASLGPALLQEATNALAYAEKTVGRWLALHMCSGDTAKSAAIAHYFNDAAVHLSHGHRIDRDEARSQHVSVEDLESDQALQEAVLTAYHLLTITFERSPATKIIANHQGAQWVKGWT